jgi:uncharacterized protein YdaT
MTTLVQKSFSMTRWHKVVERLQQSIAEATAVAQQHFNSTTFNAQTKQAYTALKVLKSRDEGLAAVNKASQLFEDIARIRIAVGTANVSRGITAKLSEIEIATRQSSLYKTFVLANDGKIDFSVFADVDVVSGSGRDLFNATSNQHGICVATDDDISRFKAEMAKHKRQATRLSDEVAELNRAPLAIGLSTLAIEAAALED